MEKNEATTTAIENKRGRLDLRWTILFLNCLATIGDYYCIDTVGALHPSFKLKFEYLGANFEYYFNMLYSVYSMPNIILPLIGGVLVLHFGLRRMYIIFGVLLTIGHGVYTLGCQLTDINIMLLGRIIFGLGAESINITQNTMLVKWFLSSEIALPLSVGLSINRLGSVIQYNLSPKLAHIGGPEAALWVAFGICIMSLIATIILCVIDAKMDAQLNDNIPGEDDIISLKSAFDLKKIVWLLVIVCFTLYGCILPFNYIAVAFLNETYFIDLSPAEAETKGGRYTSIPYFIATIMMPIFGMMIDKVGRRAYFLSFSSVLAIIVFSLFFFANPIIPLILLGFTYSLFASVIWPCLSITVKKELVGISIGMATSFQNLGLVIFPLIVASIYSTNLSYKDTLHFFIAISVVAFFFSIWIINEDKNNNSKAK